MHGDNVQLKSFISECSVLHKMVSSVRFDDGQSTSSRAPSFTRISVRCSTILNNTDIADYYKSIFETCDQNKDGVVSISELKTFIETQGNIDISEELAERIYSHFDKNKDERLDFKEFVEMVNSPIFKSTFRGLTTRICKFIVVVPKNRKALTLQRTLTGTGKYEANFQFQKSTIRMLLLSAIQILLFYVNNSYEAGNRNGPYYCTLSFQPCRKFEMYRYLTYSFVHSSKSHLYGNIFLQLMLGVPMEVIHTWRVIPVYFLSVLGGSLTHSVVHREYRLVGASGGVSGFLTIPIAAVLLNWREMSHPVVHLLFFGIITILDVIYKVLLVKADNVSFGSHLGGAVVGLLFGMNILRNLKVTKFEIILSRVCWVTLVLLGIIVVILDATLPLNTDCEYVAGNCTYLYNY